jgi:hypothetical protein
MFALFRSCSPVRLHSVSGHILAILAIGAAIVTPPAIALPGDDITAVQRWIERHPSLPPAHPGALRVSRSDIPGQRFTFRAWKILPGFYQDEPVDFIRSEQIEVRDEVEFVSIERLELVLRDLYGSDIYQDYRNAAEIYRYTRTNEADVPLEDARKTEDGMLIQGDRFAYWLRLFYDNQYGRDVPIVGQLTVLLTDDRDRLEVYLRRE